MNNLVIAIFTFVVLLHAVQGGPFQKRFKREIYPEVEPEKPVDDQPQVCVVGDLVYGAEELVPAEQPCLRCRCQPPGVHCEATRCQKKPGCRAIHKPNTCCPDYQCECEYEGRTYANGERLEQKAGTECKVCYCRGGEVQCADVSCYIRNDCEGRQVPGKCCPKYDHCPPKEPAFDRPAYTSDPNSTTKETTISVENEILDSDKQPELMKADASTHTGDENQKITIHEIIPEIKEIPITNSPKREVQGTVQGQLLVEETQPVDKLPTTVPSENLHTESNELNLPDAEPDSSEVAEIYQQPPPVLRIGDKLLFLKKGELVPEKDASTPATVITIIGAEGLQRGFEDSVENHEATIPNKTQEVKEAATIHLNASTSMEFVETSEVTTGLNEASTTELVATQSSTSPELTDDAYYTNSTIEIGVELPAFEADDETRTTDTTTEITTSSTTGVVKVLKATTEKEELQELNPEYPPIPDIMSRPDESSDHDVEQSAKREIELETKILPEVLPIRSNKSVPQNVTNSEWLKHTLININASLPDSILDEVADSDLDNVTEELSTTVSSKVQSKTFDVIEKFGTTIESTQFTQNHIKALTREDVEDILPSTQTDFVKSVESIEETTTRDSGESVTESSSVVLNENASVEGLYSTEMNKSDFVEMVPGLDIARSVDGPLIGTTTVSSDVEMINIDLFRSDVATNATHEDDDHPAKIVSKRENDDDSKVFEELDREIGLVSGDLVETKTKEEEEKEAEVIFKELLDETESSTTPKPIDVGQPRDRESAVLQRVSNAIAKFQLRDTKQSLDSNILGILRDFFSSQYRSYNKK